MNDEMEQRMAETLRRAAALMRNNNASYASRRTPEQETFLALADWLDFEADIYDNPDELRLLSAHAYRIARTYLGDAI